MDECGEKNAISLSWGRREIRISGEGATLYVNGVPHDMTINDDRGNSGKVTTDHT